MIVRSAGDSTAEIGARITVSTGTDHLHLFDENGQAFARRSKADAA
jgi:hypothetical protein